MDPVLTREELAAVVAQNAEAHAEPMPERVDLAGGDRLLRSLVPVFDRFGRAWAERLRAMLTSTLKMDVRIHVSPAEIASPGAWPRHEGYSATATLRIGEMASGGMLNLDPTLTALLVSRTFGSRRTTEVPPERRLSSVERRILAPLVESIVAEIGHALSTITPMPVALNRIEADDPPLGSERWGSAGLVIAATLQGADIGGTMALTLPSGALEPLRALAGRQDGGAGASRDGASRIGRLVCEATVELAAIIGHSRLTLAQLLALRPGDVVHLDRAVGDHIPIQVEGIAKFRGRPVLSRGSLAVELSGRMEGPQ